MFWTKSNAESITTERQVRVTSGDLEGYASIRWGRSGAMIFGPVVKIDRFFDESGSEYREPETTVLDSDPTFA